MPSAIGAGSAAASSWTRFAFATPPPNAFAPFVSFASASHVDAGTKFATAKMGGSTHSTRTPSRARLTGRKRYASDPRYAV